MRRHQKQNRGGISVHKDSTKEEKAQLAGVGGGREEGRAGWKGSSGVTQGLREEHPVNLPPRPSHRGEIEPTWQLWSGLGYSVM